MITPKTVEERLDRMEELLLLLSTTFVDSVTFMATHSGDGSKQALVCMGIMCTLNEIAAEVKERNGECRTPPPPQQN